MENTVFMTSDGYRLYRFPTARGIVWVDNPDGQIDLMFEEVDGHPVDDTGTPLEGAFLK